jgi:hypothetical protein
MQTSLRLCLRPVYVVRYLLRAEPLPCLLDAIGAYCLDAKRPRSDAYSRCVFIHEKTTFPVGGFRRGPPPMRERQCGFLYHAVASLSSENRGKLGAMGMIHNAAVGDQRRGRQTVRPWRPRRGTSAKSPRAGLAGTVSGGARGGRSVSWPACRRAGGGPCWGFHVSGISASCSWRTVRAARPTCLV